MALIGFLTKALSVVGGIATVRAIIWIRQGALNRGSSLVLDPSYSCNGKATRARVEKKCKWRWVRGLALLYALSQSISDDST